MANITFEILNNIDIVNSLNLSSINNVHHSPKITYIIEPKGCKFEDAKRVIAMVYSYNQNTVRYGASIFRKVNKNDYCIKSQIRTTAIERFNKCPVIFSINNTSEKNLVNDIIHLIRYKMYRLGVKSKNYTNESFLQETESNTINSTDSSSSHIINNEDIYNKQRLPKISYIIEPENSSWNNAQRIIAIVYSYDENKILYGASIFKRNENNEICIKSQIRETAIERFYKYPILIKILNPIESLYNVTAILSTIRKCLHKYGVKKNTIV